MAAPEWIHEALSDDLSDGEEIEAVEELEAGKLALVATTERGFYVKDRMLFSAKVHPFDLAGLAGANGAAPADEAGQVQPSLEETTTEPLPDAVGSDVAAQTDEATPPETDPDDTAETDQAPATREATPPTLEAQVGPADLSHLDGIGPARQDALAELGVETFADLADADAETLAAELGAGQALVEGWIDQADLSQLHGVGPARSTALREAGVETLDALVEVDAPTLSRIIEVPESTIDGWQDEARRLTATGENLTQIDGIGEARAQTLVGHGVSTLESLIRADPGKVADALGVNEATVEDWQKLAVEAPEVDTDLLEVDGVGAARARELIRRGIREKAALVDADPAELADALRVTEATVEAWQAAAGD